MTFKKLNLNFAFAILFVLLMAVGVFAGQNKGTLSGNMVHTIMPPAQYTATTSSDVINLAKYNHATVIINVGVAGTATFVVTVEYCDDNTPTTDTAMAFAYRIMTDGAGATDTWGALTAATTAGITLDTANQTVVIELDTIDLWVASSGSDSRFLVKITDPSAADSFVAMTVYLSESRYGTETPTPCID